MIRVLAICVEDPALILGGMGRHVRELYRAMAKRGDVEIDLLTLGSAGCRNGKPWTEFDGYRKWTIDDICNQKPQMPSMRSVLQLDVLWLSRLLSMVATGRRWDVIHAHEWSSVQVAQCLSRALDLPIVSTMHLCLSALRHCDEPMELPEATQELIRKYSERRVRKEREKAGEPSPEKLEEQELRAKLGWLANAETDLWVGNQEGKLNVETAALILCSQAYCDLSDRLFSTISLFERRVHLIPNGIDLDGWHPEAGDGARARAKHERIGQRPIALFVGRVATMKGIEYLLQATMQEDTGYQVVISGEVNADVGKEDWYVTQWIRALEERHPERLAWLGFHRDQELKDLYAAAHCVVMPSTHEPFGIVAFEAMAMGTPLIATDADGLGEVVREGDEEFALVVPPREPQAIVSALRWIKSETGRQIYRGLGLKRVHDPKFRWDNVAAQTVEVYRETVEAYQCRPG